MTEVEAQEGPDSVTPHQSVLDLVSRFKASASGAQSVAPPLPKVFAERFAGDKRVEGKLPKLPLFFGGSGRVRVGSLSAKRPVRLGRLTFDAVSCLFWHGFLPVFSRWKVCWRRPFGSPSGRGSRSWVGRPILMAPQTMGFPPQRARRYRQDGRDCGRAT